MKSLKKQNNMLFRMAKLLGLRRELNNIKKIRARASNKYESSSRDIYSSDYDSSLSSDIKWDERRHHSERK